MTLIAGFVRFRLDINSMAIVFNKVGILTLVLENLCLLKRHCVTGSGGLNKSVFGKGTKLIIETSK